MSSFYRGEFRTKLANRPEGPPTVDWGSPDLKLVCLKGNHEDIMWQCCRRACTRPHLPKDVRARQIAANGTKLYVRVGGLGPAVVLLHGYGETAGP